MQPAGGGSPSHSQAPAVRWPRRSPFACPAVRSARQSVSIRESGAISSRRTSSWSQRSRFRDGRNEWEGYRVRSRLIPAFFAVAVLAPSATPVSGAGSAELDCLIEPYVVVALSSSVEGLVEAVTVDRGDLVKEGQVLVRLESSVGKAAVAVARARAEMESGIQSSQARLQLGGRPLVRPGGLLEPDLPPLNDSGEPENTKDLAGIR